MRPEDHPAERTAHLVGRRWTALVVHHLQAGPLRHGELLARMCGVSQKTLTERLRELEAHGAGRRARVTSPSPGWAYGLTPRGHELARLLADLARWGAATLPPPPIATPHPPYWHHAPHPT
ncbi:MAG TPA: helix-turn-helix domain-containing protein, partial [Acidimicrobiales bacterium]